MHVLVLGWLQLRLLLLPWRVVIVTAVGAIAAPAAAVSICGLRLSASAATAAVGVRRGYVCRSCSCGFCRWKLSFGCGFVYSVPLGWRRLRVLQLVTAAYDCGCCRAAPGTTGDATGTTILRSSSIAVRLGSTNKLCLCWKLKQVNILDLI